MKDFAGKIAVITGGATGMGRELARQLAAEGCTVAMCDVSLERMAESQKLAMAGAPQGTRVLTYQADVAIEAQMMAWADAVRRELDTDKIHLLFNNAGIAGGGSFVNGNRAEWEKTFNVCFYGVIHGVRAFLPLLKNASEAHIVNTSSVNGFWASLGPNRPHTAYSAAKFAVKGFTEALIGDLAVNAPHIKCSLVMPGHIGTEIVANTIAWNSTGMGDMRNLLKTRGLDPSGISDEQLTALVGSQFRDNAPMKADEAARVILDGVRSDKWRILVGQDAHYLDKAVRAAPEDAYTEGFYQGVIAQTNWRI